jgi:hypothetical protein
VLEHPIGEDPSRGDFVYQYFDTGEPDLEYFDLEFGGMEIDGEPVPALEVRFVRDDPLITGIFSIN